MPKHAGHPCGVLGCPNIVERGRFCDEHARPRSQDYDAQRGTASQRGYGATWRRLREMFLRAHPVCADPDRRHPNRIEVATDVDHIVPKPEGEDEWNNLQALCHACHSHKTSKQSSGWGGGIQELGRSI